MILIDKSEEHTRKVMAYGDLEDLTLDLCSLLDAIKDNETLELAYKMAQEIFDAVEEKENDKQRDISRQTNKGYCS